MPPKSPWSKKATVNTNARKATTAEQTASVAINYGEAQDEEVEVLKAIYMDDYEQVELKGAWSTTTDRSFDLKLRSFSDESTSVVLSVRMTATYPKTSPLLKVQALENFHERTQERISNVIANRPKQFIGGVMIHEIATEIQDALEDAVQARQQGTLPSLEDERANAEEVAATFAKQAEETEAQKQQEAKHEEDRMLQRMLDEEMERREKRKPTKSGTDAMSPSSNGKDPNVIKFDQPATMRTVSETLHFNRVLLLSSTSQKRDQDIFLANPQSTDGSLCPLVIVKRLRFQKSRDQILELEKSVSAAVKLRHPGLLSVFAYRIDRLSDSRSELILCNEHGDRGSLHTWLELGSLSVSKARQFTVELLEALDYLHRNGAAHGSLSNNTIALVGSGQTISPKLADFGYSWNLQGQGSASSKWPAPEAEDSSIAVLRKCDIWHLGEIVAQMLLGSEIVAKYSSPQLLLSRLDFSNALDDFLRKIFTKDLKKRPSAFELLPAEFLRTDAPVMEAVSKTSSRPTFEKVRSNSGVYASQGRNRSRHESLNLHEPMSRYANDFTELGRLGKGGFGEVVKARNKLDGGLYAIKKIKQAPQLLDQVISEVMLLNRLNHPYVVRYYSAWIEEDASAVVFQDSTTETETTTDAITEGDMSDDSRLDFGYQSRGGLDFVSSSGLPPIEFGDDSNDDDSSDDSEGGNDEEVVAQDGEVDATMDGSIRDDYDQLRRARSDSRKAPSTLYIQMEYCERHTLRDIVRKAMTMDECWRYMRQVTEGLSHIHGHGIIHRDLKPDNIFIDLTGNPKIGDFGLATTAQQHHVERAGTMSGHSTGDMTRSVGTTLYVAPELHSVSSYFV